MSRSLRSARIHALPLALLALLAAGAPAESPPAEKAEPAPAVPVAAGIRAHIDPDTGELLDQQALDELGARAGAGGEIGHWLNTYSGDLLEVPLPGGGWMVDLQGRFQSAVVATIDPDTGEVALDCTVGPAEESEDGR